MKNSGSMKFFGSNMALIVGIALFAVSLAILVVPRLGTMGLGNSTVSSSISAQPTAVSAAARNSTDGQIASMQDRVRRDSSDYKALAALGTLFQQKARETNDPTYYGQAEDALKKALTVDPKYYDALAGMGGLQLSKHQFRDALDWGTKAQIANPGKSYAYGVIGDAQIELGLYDQAVQSFQKMVDVRPDLSSYSRVSYARELYGDIPGAIEAMQMAVNAGSGIPENVAWTRVQLGNLYLNSKQLDKAEDSYNEALQQFPGYLHSYAGLAHVAWARGDTPRAIELYKKSVAIVPLPQYLTALGDLYTVSGEKAAAREQYNLVEGIYAIFEANGVNVGPEKALFYSDHDMNATQAAQLAAEAAKVRQDVNTMDTLAWSRYKAGQYAGALEAEKSAMHLGGENATFYFHLGMIQEALGQHADAVASVKKALQINPKFSILYSAKAEAFIVK